MEAKSINVFDSVRDSLGIGVDDDSFGTEILMDINSAVLTVVQVANINAIPVTSETTWDDLQLSNEQEGNTQFGLVIQYVYVKVKLLFDPPTSSSTQQLLSSTADEMLWRIQAAYSKPKEGVTNEQRNISRN